MSEVRGEASQAVSDHSGIEWTDATWNPVTGCTKVSPGCAHCYIERTPAFRIAGRKFVEGWIPLQLHRDRIEQPLHWKKPRRVFVNSLSDLFHDDVPYAFIDKVFAVMALAPQHTFQVLTKRTKRMRAYLTMPTRHDSVVTSMDMPPWMPPGSSFPRRPADWPLPNVWLGVSVENQHFADERIPLLLATPAAVRFISAEPLLGPVDLKGEQLMGWFENSPQIDWVIVGGESGKGARPFNIAWARSIVAQCQATRVPVFVKQLGEHAVRECQECSPRFPGQCVMFGRDGHGHDRLLPVHLHRKGGDPAEWPADLRVRQYPLSRGTSDSVGPVGVSDPVAP